MATKKAASTKKATAKKPAAAKTTVRTIRADAKPKTVARPAVKAAVVKPEVREKSTSLPANIINVVFAELIGTFVLTLTAITAFTDGTVGALAVSFVFAILVLSIGAVSGAHINPAVTFGLWAMRRLKTVLVPFYWGAQFLGAMLAVLLSSWIAGAAINLSFGHFGSLNWSIFGIELIGTAVFLFGFTAAISRRDMTPINRAIGVGLSLFAGLIVAGSLYGGVRTQAISDYQGAYQTAQQNNESSTPSVPHAAYIKGATLNPAVALAATERTDSELGLSSATSKETHYSRLSWEVILGTLVGAALGGNLYLLVAGRRQND